MHRFFRLALGILALTVRVDVSAIVTPEPIFQTPAFHVFGTFTPTS